MWAINGLRQRSAPTFSGLCLCGVEETELHYQSGELRSVIVSIPKKRSNGVCRTEDFRGILLASVAFKTMCSIVQQRLVQVVEQRQLLAEE